MVNNFFRKSYRLRDNVEKYGEDGPQMTVTIWHIQVACWISRATCKHAHAHAHAPGQAHARAHTHKYAIFIFFHGNDHRERASMLRDMYTGRLVVWKMFLTSLFTYNTRFLLLHLRLTVPCTRRQVSSETSKKMSITLYCVTFHNKCSQKSDMRK